MTLGPVRGASVTGAHIEHNCAAPPPMALRADDVRDAGQRQRRLIEALRDPRHYPHAVEQVEVIETHISTVLLAGAFAYKIKKPVNLGFLDFSTLQRRQFFCEEEVRLNGRLAPHIYLGVVSIGGTVKAPLLREHGPGFEYAVRMRRFDQAGLLSRLLAADNLDYALTTEVGGVVADFHLNIAARAGPQSDYGAPSRVLAPMLENFSQLRRAVTLPGDLDRRLDSLAQRTRHRYHALRTALAQRQAAGFVRECHGDLHLDNIALVDGQITLFDGIEFNPYLRWIDTMSEIAFTVMDLDYHGAPDHGWQFLSSYLERTGDYAGLSLLDFYRAYRAMVRAKVSALRASANAGDEVRADIEAHIALAERYCSRRQPRLFITHGVSGVGKSYVAQRVVREAGAVRVQADRERKRLFGLPPEAITHAAIGAGIYSEDASERTYERLAELAGACLDSGFSVIVDAAFLRRYQRERLFELARSRDVALTLVDVTAPEAEIAQRLRARRQAATVSEAGEAVLEHQLATREPLIRAERAHRVTVSNTSARARPLPAELTAGA